MIYYNLPGLYEHYHLNRFLIEYKENFPQAFFDDVEIGSVFGNFQFCVWDGGRNFIHYNQTTKEEILEIKEYYESKNIPMRFVFTNPELTEKNLHNRFCNLILEICQNDINEVCLNSPLMEEYIRKNYPKYKIVSSTTKRLNTSETFFKELERDYFQICLDYDLNKKIEILEQIPEEQKYKCEFLVNAICPPKCPERKRHYSQTGLSQLSFLRHKYNVPLCGIKESSVHPDVLGKGNNLTPEEIRYYYDKYGFNHFKIEGRTLESIDVLCMDLYYLIKPEWYFHCLREASGCEGIYVNSNLSHKIYDNGRSRRYYSIAENK